MKGNPVSELASEPTSTPTDKSFDALPPPIAKASAPWNLSTRLVFRFAFCYFTLYALCSGFLTVWETIPWAGGYIESWLAWPFLHAAQWLSLHVFNLHGIGTTLGSSDSGDTILNWIIVGVMLVVAIVATVVWTALDHRRQAYPSLLGWFRFTLRLTLGVAMLSYGLDKVFLDQMPPPSLAVLNEPLGNTSPMMLLWTMMGLNPGYQMICGAVEVVGGLLILCRRTALLGALVTAFAVSNVVLYDSFFDVPVKIYATHLLLMALVVVVPDLRSLYSYFWLHRPTPPMNAMVPPATRRGSRIAILTVEIAVLVMALGYGSYSETKGLLGVRARVRNTAPFTGQWHVETVRLNGQLKPLLTLDGLTITDLYIEPSSALNVRASNGTLLDGDIHFNQARHTVKLDMGLADHPIVYALEQPNASHLVLTPTGNDARTESVLTLDRVPLPTHYPLLDRGVHLVVERMLLR
jgi:hypothetical protein